ncbi:polysaccharide pyruvyl transferase family protein [Alkalithermobacter paradoxus]|uniref:Polysaccharide pyruvyl transferase n=1 Tax=Alkalithermobacter paradoxus TaxID=29349 RepID=A0A1V4I5S5_9FIRM|nr:polysaccharide pyruvyl transferase [[Clostridium] thermoalcaliphilum]
MKKIGLFTINDYNNYGNRLQNYATQEYLKSLGFEVETVKNFTAYSKYVNKPNFVSRTKNLISMPPGKAYKKIKDKLFEKFNKNLIDNLEQQRINNFKKFTESYIFETDFFITDADIPNDLGRLYDCYVTGSDQVWNPYNFRTSEIDFLTFAPKNKRVALSASFGISNIPDNQINRYKEWISGIEYLSVREDDGAKIIKRLTGRSAPVLLDPTMLLDKKEWLKVAKAASNEPKKNYLLTYFLGGVPKEFNNQINRLANKNNLEIINLCDISDKEAYIAGPSEFIDYVADCKIFCTDSFHGAVFSILFEKPFIIYQREGSISMYSRINTLLEKFKLNNRKAENIFTDEDAFKVNYSHVPEILEVERKKIHNFLKKALRVEDED